uniref:hypothetical protein n=1 Tax=Trichocoleus desertorum TaxID=1481672 RepID=UPI0025B315DE|nr:hypothetical protein [Trichocoleus desertorum]
MPQSAPSKNSAWCNRAETVLIAGSIGSSVAAVVLQQVTFAAITSIQLSFVVGLNSWSRKRFDEVNQQNQAAITQLQQQLSQGQNSFAQIEQATRQLPTHEELGDLQHNLEQLEADHQKRIEQLHEELRNQEWQLSQSRNELTSLHQTLKSTLPVDMDSFQNRIHDLKAHFESKARDLEKQFNHQPLLIQLEGQVSKAEQNIIYLLKLTADQKNFKGFFSDEYQNWQKQFQELSEKVSRLSLLEKFNPEDVRSDIQILLEEIQELEALIKKPLEVDGELALNDLREQITQLQKMISSVEQKVEKMNKDCQKSISFSNKGENELKKYSKALEENGLKLAEKICMLENRIIKIEKTIISPPPPSPLYTCDRCGKASHSMLIGGPFNNSRYCSLGCMRSDRTD